MNKTVSRASKKTYEKIAKPILFKFSPDSVHTTISAVGKFTGKIPPLRGLLKASFAYSNPQFLGQTIKGIHFDNPVGLSAGFDKNFELLKLLPALGFGFVEGGSLTYHASAGNARPHYRRLPESKSILVNAGLNNHGADVIAKRIKKQGTLGYPLNISIAKTNSPAANTQEKGIADYIASLKIIKGQNIGDLITLNISCPNAFGGEPFTSPDSLNALLAAVDALKLQQPIFIKMPIDKSWNDFDELLQVIIRHKVAGVTTGNLAKDRNNAALKQPIPKTWKGNMSGLPTYDLSNKLIHKTYAKYGELLIIIGVGGIFDAQTAYEKIKHGASLVELITGLIFEGPQVIGQINKGLVDLARADGFTHISQAIGAYHKT